MLFNFSSFIHFSIGCSPCGIQFLKVVQADTSLYREHFSILTLTTGKNLDLQLHSNTLNIPRQCILDNLTQYRKNVFTVQLKEVRYVDLVQIETIKYDTSVVKTKPSHYSTNYISLYNEMHVEYMHAMESVRIPHEVTRAHFIDCNQKPQYHFCILNSDCDRNWMWYVKRHEEHMLHM